MLIPAKVKRLNAYERSRFAAFSSHEEFRQAEADAYRLQHLEESEAQCCFKVRQYKSGELSGAYYTLGLKTKVKPPVRTGPVVTYSFSQKSKSKVRRAVENSDAELTTFLTLTFSPWDLNPWEVDYYGPSARRSNFRFGLSPFKRFKTVDPALAKRRFCLVVPVVKQEYAKHRLKNFRSALTMKVNRQIACKLKELPECQHDEYKRLNKFRMVWTAELQSNGNIHFHMITNKYWAKNYLAKIWPYGFTNIKKLHDAEHAAYYMVKYISKDQTSEIRGNRYNISAILRKESAPMATYFKDDTEAQEMRRLLGLMKQTVEENGGKVIDSGFGFNFPRPRRSRVYKGKDGKPRKTRGVSKKLHQSFLDSCFPVPF
jgi:hypothetical protein